MLRVIREVRPTYIVGENVSGLVNWSDGLVFDEVQSDLEAIGYEVTSFILPACATGAPHRRDRIWIIAKNAMCSGCVCGGSGQEGAEVWKQRNACAGSCNGICLQSGVITNANGERFSGEKHGKTQSGFSSENCKRTDWHNFPTQSPVCFGNDGIPAGLDGITFSKWRNESIKAAGNAVVPQVVLKIFEAINTIHKQHTNT